MQLTEEEVGHFRTLVQLLLKENRAAYEDAITFLEGLCKNRQLDDKRWMDLCAHMSKVVSHATVDSSPSVKTAIDAGVGPTLIAKLEATMVRQQFRANTPVAKKWACDTAYVLTWIWQRKAVTWEDAYRESCNVLFKTIVSYSDEKAKDRYDENILQCALGFWTCCFRTTKSNNFYLDLLKLIQQRMPFPFQPVWMAQFANAIEQIYTSKALEEVSPWLELKQLLIFIVENYPRCVETCIRKSKESGYQSIDLMAKCIWHLAYSISPEDQRTKDMTRHGLFQFKWLTENSNVSKNNLDLSRAYGVVRNLSSDYYIFTMLPMFTVKELRTLYHILDSALDLTKKSRRHQDKGQSSDCQKLEEENKAACKTIIELTWQIFRVLYDYQPTWWSMGVSQIPFESLLPKLRVVGCNVILYKCCYSLARMLLCSDPSRTRYSISSTEFSWILDQSALMANDGLKERLPLDIIAMSELYSAVAWYFAQEFDRQDIANFIGRVMYYAFKKDSFLSLVSGALGIESRFMGIVNLVSTSRSRIACKSEGAYKKIWDSLHNRDDISQYEQLDIMIMVINLSRDKTARKMLAERIPIGMIVQPLALDVIRRSERPGFNKEELKAKSKILFIALINLSKDCLEAKQLFAVLIGETSCVILQLFMLDREVVELALWAFFNMATGYNRAIEGLFKHNLARIIVEAFKKWKHDPRVAARGCKVLYLVREVPQSRSSIVQVLRRLGAQDVVATCAASDQMKAPVMSILNG